MSYSSDRRQSKSGAVHSVAQRHGSASIIDQRASAADHLQLKQKIDESMAENASRSVKQLMTEEELEEAPAQLMEEEDEMVQGNLHPAQRAKLDHDEAPPQGEFARATTAQLVEDQEARGNDTGLPDYLKSGIENLSGMNMDHVKVHYNSSQPARLNAHAYAQESDIHIAPGQEHHIAHEAWHVVQQKQGRVKPTMQMKTGVCVNDDEQLEAEADMMAIKLGAPAQDSTTWRRDGRSAAPLAEDGQRSVVELAYPQQAADSAPAQLLANANVVVFDRSDGNGAIVMAVNFAERVPTTLGDGQGDHVIAEVLIHESISWLKGRTVRDYLYGLQGLVNTNLDDNHQRSRHTSQIGDSTANTKEGLSKELETQIINIENTPAANFAFILSELTTKYWRLLEKRYMTAFNRTDGRTSGGGYEKAAMEQLRRVKERLHSKKGGDIDYNVNDALEGAIGYGPMLMDVLAHKFHIDELGILAHRAAIHVADFMEIPGENYEDFVGKLEIHMIHDFTTLRNVVATAASASDGIIEEQKSSMDE